MNSSRQSFVSHKVITVPGSDNRSVKVTGSYFLCSEATGAFNVSFDGGEAVPFNVGMALRFLPGDFFTEIGIHNPGTDEITVEIYTGSSELIDARLNVVRQRPMPIMWVPPETVVYSAGITSLAGLANQACPGTRVISGGNYVRKEIIVTNLDPTNDLDVRLADGTTSFAMVLARTAWVLETNASLVVVNPNASAMAVRIGETFYASV